MRALVVRLDGTRNVAHAHGALTARSLNPMQDVIARTRKIEHHALRGIAIHALFNQQFAHARNVVVAVVLTRHHKHQVTTARALVKTARIVPATGDEVGCDLLGRIVFTRARRGAQKVQAIVALILGGKQRTLKKLAHRLLTCKIGSELLVVRRRRIRLAVEIPHSHGQTSDLVVTRV